MSTESLNGVLGTGRLKPAGIRQQGGNGFLIDLDQQDQESCCKGADVPAEQGNKTWAAVRISSSSCITAVWFAFFIRLRGISTMRHGRIRLLSRRKLSHITLRARFRSTASRLNFLLQMTPHLANFPSPGMTETAINAPARRKGALFRRSNSDLRCSLELLRRCKRWSAKIRSLN